MTNFDLKIIEDRLSKVRDAIRGLIALKDGAYNKDGHYNVTRITIENKYFGYAQYNRDITLEDREKSQCAGQDDFTLPLSYEQVDLWIEHLRGFEKELKDKQIALLEADLAKKKAS